MQETFTIRASSSIKQIHLVGSWDNYREHLPLSRDKTSSKNWIGTFKFPSDILQPGQRYWYYYILDGYHNTHNPAEESMVEPQTGQKLNILDVSASKSSSSGYKSSSRSHRSAARSSRAGGATTATDVPKGRPLSMSKIQAPTPLSPKGPRHILDADMDELSTRLAATGMYDQGDGVYDYYTGADGVVIPEYGGPVGSPASARSSLSYRSDSSSPISPISSGASSSLSASGYSTPDSDCSGCTCERYGITRRGERVRIDCGGELCGYGDSCSSASEDEVGHRRAGTSRRNGVVVR